MAGQELVDIRKREVIDFDDQYNTIDAAADTADQAVVSFRTKTGKRPYLVALGNGIGAGGAALVTFRLLQNKQRIYPYDGSLNQWGDPTNLQRLIKRIELGQNALIEVMVDNADPANTFESTARLLVEYEDF